MEKYRDDVKRELRSRHEEFWKTWSELKPKDKVDSYIKMMAFAIPKAPEVPVLTPEQEQQKIVLEETRKATIISGGIPKQVEDYEPDDDE